MDSVMSRNSVNEESNVSGTRGPGTLKPHVNMISQKETPDTHK